MIDSYVCVDLETTGLNPKKDKIIEIGAVKIKNGKQEGIFESFVNPGRKLEERVTTLTNIKDEDLVSAPFIEEVLPELLEFLEEVPLLGHRVLFDYSFLKRAAVNQGKKFERKGIDTLKISRKYLSHLESRGLHSLCEYYKIPHSPHRALEDAQATRVLFEHLKEDFFTKENEKDFMPVPLIYQVKKESPITNAQKERLERLLEFHQLEKDFEISKMTKNEASRMIDQILAKYGRWNFS